MLCPKCSEETNVTDSRPTGYGVRRRRKCVKCGYRISTVEIAITDDEKRRPLAQFAVINKIELAHAMRGALEIELQRHVYGRELSDALSQGKSEKP